MCSLRAGLLLALCVLFSGLVWAQRSQLDAGAAALTNKDVLEMLKAGLGQEIVMAKIKSSSCAFDTSPEALKSLKALNVPDAIILEMVKAPVAPQASAALEPSIRTARVDCLSLTQIDIFTVPGSSTSTGHVKCGETIAVLSEQGSWDKVRSVDGKIGYISKLFVSSEASGPVASASPPAPSVTRLPNNVLRAVAWRGVPWVTTSYYQQQGSASTDCTGSGTWTGDIWRGNSSCTTQYTPAQSVPINWQHYTIYNLVETSDSMMVLACTRNWAFSKCSYLIPGNTFEFDDKKGKISVKGHRGGKDKELALDFDIVSSESKTGR